MYGKPNWTRKRELSACEHIDAAIDSLRTARHHLKQVECPNTLARVRRAITSCEGALRNQQARDTNPGRKVIRTAKFRNRNAAFVMRSLRLPTLPEGRIPQAHSAHAFADPR